ncbi:MAG: hypothetical protein JWN79_1517, partial [Gemmatimonadetes bacterium]|nr:hypothetical protein [Gemmatimonadota bacterium]
MASFRARLTVAYAFALVGAMLLFAAALYFARIAWSRQELDPVALAQGDRALSYLRAASIAGRTLTLERASGDSGQRTRVVASDAMRSILERVPGYFIVYDRDDRQLYSSIGIRQLPEEDRSTIDEVAVKLKPGGEGALVSVSDTL